MRCCAATRSRRAAGLTEPTQRWALLVEYDGGPFVGWQRQASGPSVQAVLEQAAGKLNGGAPVVVIAAGRTDAGVHAAGQVAHLDLPARFDPTRVREALNYHIGAHPVSVVRAAMVGDDFSARHSARARHYRYVILNRRARAAIDRGRVWHVARSLDVAAMAEAATGLLGRHDFTSFRASACQAASPVRTLDRLDVIRVGDRIEIAASARSFLHHQVRNMVGSLKLVGQGVWPPGRMAAALDARDRAAAGPTAPPDGLCLMAVDYDPDPFL